MILVTVGNHTQGFPRLIRKMDEFAEKMPEEVIMQIGATDYHPQNARHFRSTSQEEMDRLNREARLVVTHAGAGSILTGLKWGKPMVIVPRLAKYGEHFDDHQLQLADVLSQAGKVITVYEVEELEEAINRASQMMPSSTLKGSSLVSALRTLVEELDNSYTSIG